MLNNYNCLPWVEKYRPVTIEDIISHDQNIKTIKQLLLNNSLPHLLFFGSPGTGKTSTIISLANQIYGDNLKLMVMKLDASDDRGITSVREDIKEFAEKTNIFIKGVRLIILDEVDSMTFDAQFALRRIIEKYSASIRFCLICNYENKIIPAIRSRCSNFRFSNIDMTNIKIKLVDIINKEKLNYNDELINTISLLAKGDLRKAINLLQSISMNLMHTLELDKNTNIIDICYDIACIPNPNELKIIINTLFNKNDNFNMSYNIINKLINEKCFSLLIILKELTYELITNYLHFDNMSNIIYDLSELEYMVTKSNFCDIYISALISIFKKYYN